MTWHLTMLLVHVVAFVVALVLYRAAPCWMQKLVILGMAAAMLVAAVSFAFAVAGYVEYRWPIFMVALALEHIAVLLYLFRVVYREKLQWTSLDRFLSSPH